MNREFLVNLLFLMAINIVIKPFYVFGVDLQVQNEVGKAAYGLYFALFNFSFIFQIFADLGIQQYNNRNIAQHSFLLDKYFSTILMLKGGLGVLFFALSLGTAWILGYEPTALYLLLFLLCNQVFITFTFFFRSNISGLQHYRLDSFLSVLDKLLMIVGCVPLLYFGSQTITIEHFVYIQTAAFGATTLVSFWFARRYLRQAVRLRWNVVVFKAILKQSVPFALVVLLMSLYARIDAVMIERLLPQSGKVEAGVYAAGYRLLDAINMLGYLFAGLLLPMFSKMLKAKNSINDLLSLSGRIMFVISSSFSIAVCFHALSIVQWLYTDSSVYMSEVLILLILGFNAIGIIHIVGTLLTANGNLKQMNIVFVIGIAVNVVTNYILIGWYGAWGAALTTIITQSLVALIELAIAKRAFNFSWNLLFVAQAALYLLSVLGINYLLTLSPMPWQLQFVVGGIVAVLAAVALQILPLRLIFGLFKTKPS